LNQQLAPTYQYLFGDYWVLWFAKSNSYSVINASFKRLLDGYLKAKHLKEFENFCKSLEINEDPHTLAVQIKNYLISCQNTDNKRIEYTTTFDNAHRHITKYYRIKDKQFEIHYDSELVLKTIHPPIAHLESNHSNSTDIVFDIYLHESHLCLFKNDQCITCVPKRDYHLIQGKFIMQLICSLYDNEESDWIGTFHGSTITDGNTAILCIGASGSGKSTLTSLLALSGFDLLSDDVSPLLAKNEQLYHNPLAVSVKSGSFDVLQPLFPEINKIESINFNPSKGPLKYIPFSAPAKLSFPCKTILLVNYKSNTETKLENVSVKTLLEVLIKDTWLSPNPKHARQFLEWLKGMTFYQLTYSNTLDVIDTVSKIFRAHENNDISLS
jgi:hypothetical protein